MATFITGCADPARPHLEELVGRYGQVVGKQFPERNSYSGDERKIRYFYLQSEATNKMLTDYLQTDRPISDDLKRLLADWREATARSMAIHGKMIDEKRFNYHEDEKEMAERLIRAEASAGFELMEHLKGY
ncbi:MAG: hypothetical protein ACTHK7_20890 [Aureliella sp.]